MVVPDNLTDMSYDSDSELDWDEDQWAFLGSASLRYKQGKSKDPGLTCLCRASETPTLSHPYRANFTPKLNSRLVLVTLRWD